MSAYAYQEASSLVLAITARSSRALVRDAVGGDATAKTVLAAADQLLWRIHRRSARTALPSRMAKSSAT